MTVENRPTHPNGQNSQESSIQNAIETWRDREPEIIKYPGGIVRNPQGAGYRYPPGRRLIIGGELVMDTCEAPWAFDTVCAAFRRIFVRDGFRNRKLNILERGAGLNIMGHFITNNLLERQSGEYHIIELNRGVIKETQKWINELNRQMDNDRFEYGRNPDIQIFLHEGDAREVTKKLIVDQKKRFDIIFSDTYPLNDSETGINDIGDLDIIKMGLRRRINDRIRHGIFAFFPYHPGSQKATEDGYITMDQSARLAPHFRQRVSTYADVRPAEGYRYLFGPNGEPVRKLPVVICANEGLT